MPLKSRKSFELWLKKLLLPDYFIYFFRSNVELERAVIFEL